MVFFDLNVPYLESDGGTTKDNAALKAARLKVVVKAMELGYSGVAYDRAIRGVMSDKDRCSIPHFPLSSLLKVAPTISASVSFHRGLLRVPLSAPFRQYKRLTVAADSVAHVAALNSGNAVLRTYDFVAVRPLNQAAFDQACTAAEVDLIAIDFSQRLPFRLKLPMVKAAIKRGICFEITYSHFLSNVQSRRQMLSGAKLLVDWTRGKNLIFSSAATSADEVRGPYDVANLSCLLGLSSEQAKAAVSKNCRALLERVSRKRFYKEAIRIEKLSPSAEQLNSGHRLLIDWSNWDPISSGDGDLPPVEEFDKHFSNAAKVSKNNFSGLFTVSNKNALQDPISCTQDILMIPSEDTGTATPELVSCLPTNNVLGDPKFDSIATIDDQGCALSFYTPVKPADAAAEQSELAKPGEYNLSYALDLPPTNTSLKASICSASDEPAMSNDNLANGSVHLLNTDNVVSYLGETRVLFGDFSGDAGSSMECTPIVDIASCDKGELEPPKNLDISYASPMVSNSFSDHYHIESKTLSSKKVASPPSNATPEKTVAAAEDRRKYALSSFSTTILECIKMNTSNLEETTEAPQTCERSLRETNLNISINEQEDNAVRDTPIILAGGDFHDRKLCNGFSALPVVDVSIKQIQVEKQEHAPTRHKMQTNKHDPGKVRFIRRLRHEALRIPSKGLFKPLLFRRKIHRLKGSRKQCSSKNQDVHI